MMLTPDRPLQREADAADLPAACAAIDLQHLKIFLPQQDRQPGIA